MHPLRSSILAAFVLFPLAGASCGPNRQPPPDPAAMRQTRWPACINALMKERMAACPSPKDHLGPEPGACTPAVARAVRRAPIDLDALTPPSDVLAASAPLSKAATSLEEATDGKGMARAKRAFDRATASSTEGSLAWVWAQLGSARVQRRLSAHDRALEHAIAARRAALGAPSMPMTATRRAVIATYAAAGDASAAYADFRTLSTDGRSEDADTLAMCIELAEELAVTGKLDAAAVVLSKVREMDPDRDCLHASRLTRLAQRQQDRKATAAALSSLVDEVQGLSLDAPQRASCRRETAQLLAELGDTWQAEGTKALDEVVLDYAAQAHEVLLSLFDQQELDSHGVCIDRRDLAHRYANLLMVQKNWNKCGVAYESALREDARGERGERAALAAVTCRQRAWLEDGARLALAGDADRMLASIGRADDWRMMLRSFHRYVCVARDDDAGAEPVSNAAYARAEAFHEGGALWESAVAFRLLAFSPEQGAISRLAAKRYAEIMDDLAADDVCQIELQLDLERLDRMHCRGGDDESCTAIHTILDRIRRPIL